MRGPRCGVSYLMRSGNRQCTFWCSLHGEPTELAVVGALVGRAWCRRGIWRAGRHEDVPAAEVVVRTLGRSEAALLLRVSAAPSVFWWRRQWVVGVPRARLQAHVVHAGRRPLHLQVPQLRLKVVNVPAAILDLPIESREHGRVVGGLAHGICSVDQGAFPVNLLLHLGHGVVDVGHGGGSLCASVRRVCRLLFADSSRRWCLAVGRCVGIASTPKRAPVVRSVGPDVRVLSPYPYPYPRGPRGISVRRGEGGRLGGSNDGSLRVCGDDVVKPSG